MVDRVLDAGGGPRQPRCFSADHPYVQPHSGIAANLVAFWAILAHRVERPALPGPAAKHVERAGTPAVWELLRNELNAQRMMGMSHRLGGHT